MTPYAVLTKLGIQNKEKKQKFKMISIFNTLFANGLVLLVVGIIVSIAVYCSKNFICFKVDSGVWKLERRNQVTDKPVEGRSVEQLPTYEEACAYECA